MEPEAVLCVNTVEDDEGIYNIKGKYYDIYEIHDDTFIIEAESSSGVDEIQIPKDDKDFLVVLGKE
ncbi:hypothetical protein P59_120 [Bacillus phage P59]|nr:hypothetical protein P59_120 [Bacillus phage P59]